VIVAPEEPADVIAAVRFARKHELPVAAQGTGHGPIFGCNGGVLINNRRMKKIAIDRAEARIARVEAGVVWGELLDAAHPYGLAGLSGTSPDVGVVGYTLGGGTGWLARQYGYACDSVTAVEIVTGDGRLLRATEQEYPDLFWAVRGGGGSFGVVTALEFRLYPVSMVYGGIVVFPDRARVRGFRTYVEWTRTVTRKPCTSTMRDCARTGRTQVLRRSAGMREHAGGGGDGAAEAVACAGAGDGRFRLDAISRVGADRE
jgi:FAD/FMN-containing dehydrogenase